MNRLIAGLETLFSHPQRMTLQIRLCGLVGPEIFPRIRPFTRDETQEPEDREHPHGGSPKRIASLQGPALP